MRQSSSADVRGVAHEKPTPHIEVRGLNKYFGAVRALSDVSLSIERGMIRALVGENGAGKSTLAKIIAGLFPPSEGELSVDGRKVNYRSPKDALADGITIVKQEITLVPKLSVLENVFLGTGKSRFGIVDVSTRGERFEELNVQSGLDLPADVLVDSLSLADQKRVEIFRALARDARLIVMDEPTAMLPLEEAKKLHKIVRRLRDDGTTIIYVSHFLREVLELSDTVTVLRNGEVIETCRANEATTDDLVTLMLGRPLTLTFPPKSFPDPDSAVVLSIKNVTSRPVVDRVSLEIRSGEIVGLAGLVGSGRSELARAMFGADPLHEGEISLNGHATDIRAPYTAIRAGIAFLPENRKEQGLHMRLPVRDNVTLPHLKSLSRKGIVAGGYERRKITDLLHHVDVRPPDASLRVTNLSGGNQQKVLFAKWLFHKPRVLIADEPTAGIDVGAKRAIYELIVSLAEDGMAVLLISSELEEILGLAHRILVMRRGRIVAEFDGGSATEDEVMRAAFATGNQRDDT